MPSNIVIKDDFKGLDNLKKNLKENKVVKVGIFSNKNARRGKLTNVKVGMKHEFGSFSEGIPRRSFLKDPINIKREDLFIESRRIIKRDIASNNGNDKILETMGVIAEGIIQNAFETGGFGTWKPLSQTTINNRKKKSSSILINTAQLRRSITSKVE